MAKRIFTVLALVLPLAAAGQRPAHPTHQEIADMSTAYEKLSDFYRILAGNYLDTVNYAAIVERGITSMLSELDPHSVYLTAKERQASHEDLDGSFSGIGIEFNTLNDTITVVGTIAGGPAEKVGMAPNDRIVKIDEKSAIGMPRADVPKHIRGPKGSKVALTVYRRGTPGTLDFVITRDDIPMNTVDAAYKVDARTGYIRVNRFGATTGREFADAFESFGGVDALILDLRGNGGGYLPQAIYMSEFLLDKGQRIVSTEGNMYPPQSYTAERTGRFGRGRLIVLVDEASASASEIVAGAVQDWDRGIVVGRPTFGKGLVQREFPLDDDSAVRITISRYLTPTGRAIQRPYERGRSEEYYAEHIRRYRGAADDTPAAEYRTLRTGRTVYGGGGIRPDVHVAADTTGYSAWWSRIMRAGLLHEFTQNYLDRNRASLAAEYPDIERYISRFDAEALLPALADYAASHGVERDSEGMERSHRWLAAQLKALVAQRLWDTTGYFRVFNATLDEVFAKARTMMLRWQGSPADPLYAPDAPVSEELLRQLAR